MREAWGTWRLGTLCLLAWACAAACDRSPRGAVPPAATATPPAGVATASPAPTPTPGVSTSCRAPTSDARLIGPSDAAPRDLDLQFHWRAATTCQDLHELEADAGFGPLERLVIRGGDGHRVLLLLSSLHGATSVARWRVSLADAPDASFVAWLTIEESALGRSDGVDFAVGVADASTDPATVPLEFRRLTPDEAKAGWRPLRVDLSAWRGRDVWLVLASREYGDRSGDWLLWGDPRVVVAAPEPALVDLRDPDPSTIRALREVPWRETNVFKAYSGFNEDKAAELGADWMRRLMPWLASLRLFSSLGANWGPTLARDYEAQQGHNPTRDSTEERRWAEHYEFFHDGPGWEGKAIAQRFDWRRFDRLFARIAASGTRLHVNLAGAPELFTGGRGHYHTYHFNEMPVVDEQGWKAYVDAVFRHLAQQPWFARAEFSFFSEPNSRWIADDGSVRHFGYQGDAAQYGRQYLWTWQAMKPFVRRGQVIFGPFVVEPDGDVPAADGLPAFVRAVRDAFATANEPLPPWSAFSINLYETPQLSIDHFASARIDDVRRVLPEELPGVDLPLRFDEIGIHPLITREFAAAGVADFENSRWAAAWHAEMLALLVEQRILVGSPWLHEEMLRPYGSYVFASLASGAFAPRTAQGPALDLVAPSYPPAKAHDVHVVTASSRGDRVGHLWSVSPLDGAVRVLAWQLPRFPQSDAGLAADDAIAPLHLRLPSCGGKRCVASVLGYEGQVFADLSGEPIRDPERVVFAPAPQLGWLRRETRAATGDFTLGLRPGEVWLLEVTPEVAR